jgi:hypothetical protein
LCGLTCHMSGEPKASPLDGLVRERVGNARSQRLERKRGRAQWREASVEVAEIDLHSVFVFQVRLDGKCFDRWQAP